MISRERESSVAQLLSDLFFPRLCAFCEGTMEVDADSLLCRSCADSID